MRGLPARPVGLSDLDLTAARLAPMSRWTRVHGRDLRFDRADLRGLAESRCRFTDCSFDRAKLTHSHLSLRGTSVYRGCTFRNTGLGRTSFTGARFEGCLFEDAQFAWSVAASADVFCDSRFAGAMKGLLLRGGTLRCDLSEVTAIDIGLSGGVDLSQCTPPADTGRVRLVLETGPLWRQIEALARAEPEVLAVVDILRAPGQPHQLFELAFLREMAPNAADALWELIGECATR